MSERRQTGGAEWERGEAAQLLADAVQRGDAQAIVVAADRLGDSLINGTASRLIPTLQHVLEIVLKRELGSVTERLDQRDRRDLDWRTELRSHLDDRFDAYGRELDAIGARLDDIGLLNIRVTDLEQRLSAAELRETRLEAEQSQQRADIAMIRRVLEALSMEGRINVPRD